MNYGSTVEKGTRALHGGIATSYRVCRSWWDVDRFYGPYEPPPEERGHTQQGDWMFHYRDHYFHDIFGPQMELDPGAQPPIPSRGFGASGPVHLRIIHPRVLCQDWWKNGVLQTVGRWRVVAEVPGVKQT